MTANWSIPSKSERIDLDRFWPWALIALYFCALSLRLWYFHDLWNTLGADGLATHSADVENYMGAGRQILERFDFSHRGIAIFGPGYPTFLALIGSLSHFDLTTLTLFQIGIVSWAPVLLCHLAFQLTQNRAVSLLAGTLSALSAVSICLSSILMSDTIFLLTVVAALILFIRGLQRQGIWLFLLTALLLSFALLTRSIGMLLPMVFLVIAIIHLWPIRLTPLTALLRRLRGPLLVILIPAGVGLAGC